MGKRKTHTQFMDEVKEINPNIELIGEYTRRINRIECKCKIDGFLWNPVAYSLLSGEGCPRCGNRSKAIKMKITQSQFIEEMKKANPNVEILGEYISRKTKIKARCKLCYICWNVRPDDLMHGHGCPACGNKAKHLKQKKDKKQFLTELEAINKAIQIHGDYINSATKIKCSCNLCGVNWETLPNSLLLGIGCPECGKERSGLKRRKTHEDFIKELSNTNSNIKVLENYTLTVEKVKCRCRTCGNEWRARAGGLLNGFGCPKCSASQGERHIDKILKKYNINFIPQHKFEDCKDKYPLPFDFYLPSKNIVIEYDGRQHFEAIDYFGGKEGFKGIQKRDQIKNNYCKKKSIKLIRISYATTNIEEYLIQSIS